MHDSGLNSSARVWQTVIIPRLFRSRQSVSLQILFMCLSFIYMYIYIHTSKLAYFLPACADAEYNLTWHVNPPMSLFYCVYFLCLRICLRRRVSRLVCWMCTGLWAFGNSNVTDVSDVMWTRRCVCHLCAASSDAETVLFSSAQYTYTEF